MSNVEARFEEAMVELYKVAKRDCNYTATYFWNMVLERGGLATAKFLLATNQPSDGFTTLYLCGRLDLTVEAHVIREEFQPLFTSEEIATAKRRLDEYGYKYHT